VAFGEVKRLVTIDEKSNSHDKHFATQFLDAIPFLDSQFAGTPCGNIWQGNVVSAVKTFATKNTSFVFEKEPQF